MSDNSREWLRRIHALPRPSATTAFRIMNVCGGHERTLSMTGMRTLLPDYIELIPGPGCPVCICPEEDVSLAIAMALNNDITLLSFGDMLRVPVNISAIEQRAGLPRTLAQAAARGAFQNALAEIPLGLLHAPLHLLRLLEQAAHVTETRCTHDGLAPTRG